MKVLFFRFLALYAFFCTCSCMDGFFNSSGFDSMDEDFGMEFCTSALGPLGNFCSVQGLSEAPEAKRGTGA